MKKTAFILGSLGIGFLLVIVLCLGIYVVYWVAPYFNLDSKRKALSQESITLEIDYHDFADNLVDHGFSPGYLGEEKLLLDERIIISTSNVNAYFSRELLIKLNLLNQLSAQEPIDLYLRTEGGWEADIFSVIDTMQSIQAPVNVHAMGEVHSAGIMLLAAATGERVVYPNTILGFHALSEDEEKLSEQRYQDFWKKHAQLPSKWLKKRTDEMYYFTAQEAISYGVADRVHSVQP